MPFSKEAKEEMKNTSRAFTLKGALYAEAIISKKKRVENRHFSIRPGYYFLHVGQGKLSKDRERLIHSISADLPGEADLCDYKSKVLGVVHVKGSFKLSEVETNDPWATGPICNEIDEVYRFDTPVSAKGSLSIWDLSKQDQSFTDAQVEIEKVLARVNI